MPSASIQFKEKIEKEKQRLAAKAEAEAKAAKSRLEADKETKRRANLKYGGKNFSTYLRCRKNKKSPTEREPGVLLDGRRCAFTAAYQNGYEHIIENGKGLNDHALKKLLDKLDEQCQVDTTYKYYKSSYEKFLENRRATKTKSLISNTNRAIGQEKRFELLREAILDSTIGIDGENYDDFVEWLVGLRKAQSKQYLDLVKFILSEGTKIRLAMAGTGDDLNKPKQQAPIVVVQNLTQPSCQANPSLSNPVLKTDSLKADSLKAEMPEILEGKVM